MKSARTILISVDEEERARFFLRFEKGLNFLGYRIIYIADRFSVYKYIQKQCSAGNSALFLNRRMIDSNISIPDLNECLELRLQQDTLNNMKLVYQTVWGIRRQIDWPVAYVFIWNGCKTMDYALTLLAKKYEIPTVFFEIANIPGKIFVDPEGTNAYSYLYKHPDVLAQYDVNSQDYESWLQNYINKKLQENTVKQAKGRSLEKSIKATLIDISGYYFHQGIRERGIPWRKFKTRVRAIFKKRFLLKDNTWDLPSKYLFFPLQVASDTQIVIHAREGLESSLRKAILEARRLGLWLVIKPHPADPNPLYVNRIIREEYYNNILISKANTFKLILHAERVFTINSTVGLETLILGRPLTVIGQALYETFTEEDIKRYIMGYLIDVDYWGKEPLATNQLQKILKRANVNS